ncbi:hypothetical protein MHYP_G00288950 [Metynnis hypsauchen]
MSCGLCENFLRSPDKKSYSNLVCSSIQALKQPRGSRAASLRPPLILRHPTLTSSERVWTWGLRPPGSSSLKRRSCGQTTTSSPITVHCSHASGGGIHR